MEVNELRIIFVGVIISIHKVLLRENAEAAMYDVIDSVDEILAMAESNCREFNINASVMRVNEDRDERVLH